MLEELLTLFLKGGSDREVVVTSIAICWLLPKVIRILFQLVGLPGDYRTIGEFEAVFLKNVKNFTLSLSFGNFPFLRLIMQGRMQEGLLLYRLLGRRKDTNR